MQHTFTCLHENEHKLLITDLRGVVKGYAKCEYTGEKCHIAIEEMRPYRKVF